MRLKHLSLVTFMTLVTGLGLALTLSPNAAPVDFDSGGTVIPLGER